MTESYSVEFKVHNKTSDAWANKVSYQDTDKDLAFEHYFSELARLWNAKDFDFVQVSLIGSDDYYEYRKRDGRAVVPEVVS